MRYFKVKKIVTEYETKSLVAENQIKYAELTVSSEVGEQVYEIIGAENIEEAAQHEECAVEELTFEEAQPILNECALMKSFNEIIERKIAEKYSIGRELKMVKLPSNDPERVEYEAFIESVKAPIRVMKQEKGLIL